MTRAELEQAVLASLASVAPEMDPAQLRSNVALREQLDLDSFDFLQFVVRLHERLGVDIPETDYAKLRTLETTVSYLQMRTAR